MKLKVQWSGRGFGASAFRHFYTVTLWLHFLVRVWSFNGVWKRFYGHVHQTCYCSTFFTTKCKKIYIVSHSTYWSCVMQQQPCNDLHQFIVSLRLMPGNAVIRNVWIMGHSFQVKEKLDNISIKNKVKLTVPILALLTVIYKITIEMFTVSATWSLFQKTSNHFLMLW